MSPPLLPLPPCRILIVDDNVDAAETLGALLESLGASVLVVFRGQEALERAVNFRPDVALLDIGMPDVNGYEVARRIRATSSLAGVLLIALSGWGQEEDFRRSQDAGFDHHLIKPPDLDKLAELLRSNRTRAEPGARRLRPRGRAGSK